MSEGQLIRKSAHWYVAGIACVLITLPAVAAAQVPGPFAGVWVLDSEEEASNVYAEVRVVRQADNELRLSMVDYGTAWIGGEFRTVVRIMPWTFRVDAWGPRRGAETSTQPKTRVRISATHLVLGKLTERGNGDFVWVWRLSDDRGQLTHWESRKSWADEPGDGPMRGDGLKFVRASSRDASPKPIEVARTDIMIRVSPDASSLLASCPAANCRLVEFHSGRQTGTRVLPKGEWITLSLDAEIRIEPVP